MRKYFLILILFFISFISCKQTAEDYNKKGLAKFNVKDYKRAIADYTKAIEINPNNAETYYNRGRAKNYLKDYCY